MHFAKEHFSKLPKFCKIVIFSEESKLCIFGIKGNKLVWRKTGEALEKQNLLPIVTHELG